VRMGFELHQRQLQNPAFISLNRPKNTKIKRFSARVTPTVTTKLGLKLGRIS